MRRYPGGMSGAARRHAAAAAASYNAKMRMPPRWLLVLVLVGAAAALLRYVAFRPRPVEVEVARADVGVVEETVTNTRAGTLKARRRAKLSPQMGGRVVDLPFHKGDRVERGAVLLRLDDSLQKAQLGLAEEDRRVAAARSDEACLAATLAERQYRRGAALSADGITSAETLDTLESSRDQAFAACRAARAAQQQADASVEVARAELAFTTLTAPFAGVIADCSTEVGEWITPSPPGVPIPAVLDLLDPTSTYVTAPIDEVDSERVRVGQPVRIQVDSRPGEHMAGTLVRVAPYVLDVLEQNRTVEVEAEFADPAEAASVLPGTSADVEIILSRREHVLRVPTAAIAEGRRVLVLTGGRLEERSIEVGLRNWQYTQVTGGLREGDQVVTVRDSTAIKPGARAVAKPR
jgi:HlyD family secretion protein